MFFGTLLLLIVDGILQAVDLCKDALALALSILHILHTEPPRLVQIGGQGQGEEHGSGPGPRSQPHSNPTRGALR